MQKNDSLSVDENVEIKGQKIISNSSLTNQLCFTPLFGFEMVRCACWFSYIQRIRMQAIKTTIFVEFQFILLIMKSLPLITECRPKL